MVALPDGPFNASQHQPSEGASPVLPDGIYPVAIVKSELKATRNQDGQMLVLTLNVLAGEFQGRRLTARYNVQNPNADAVRIAKSELTSLSLVVGVPFWQTSEQLHGRPFQVKVEKEERNDRPGQFNNRIAGYLDAWGNPPNPANGGQSQGNPAPAQPTPPQQPAQIPFQQPAQFPNGNPQPDPNQYQHPAIPNQQPATGYPQMPPNISPNGMPPAQAPAYSPQTTGTGPTAPWEAATSPASGPGYSQAPAMPQGMAMPQSGPVGGPASPQAPSTYQGGPTPPWGG